MPPPTNLPYQTNSFVGREAEVAEIRRLLSSIPHDRLLTLTGPGGCGKTRLALQAAASLLDSFPDGVWLVELAALSDPALVPQAVASTLDVREAPGSAQVVVSLTHALQSRKLLLLLDNCEHLIEACAQLAETLLQACPHLLILATSRESLNIPGEVSWPVPPLSVPDSSHLPPRAGLVSVLGRYESVRLFTERTAAVLPGFRLSEENALSVAQICHRMDGMPLALELAAARAKVLAVEQIAARLDDAFNLLATGARTAFPRHQTLRATMDWSHDLLSEREQVLFRRLAVFAGSFTLEAVEAICAYEAIESQAVLDLLSSLISKSLVIVKEHGRVARYHLLETVRQYAGQRLEAAGERNQIRDRHLDWYLALTSQAEPELHRHDQFAWLDRLDAELDNVRAALEWSLAGKGRAEVGLRLAGALWWYWVFRSHWSEGRRWLNEAVTRSTSGTPAHAKALTALGTLIWLQGDLTTARTQLEESVACWRHLGDNHGLGYALMILGEVVLHQGDPALARAYDEESIALLREGEDPWGLALALSSLGEATTVAGDFEAARSLIAQSMSIFRDTGDKWGLAITIAQQGWLALRQGDYAAARAPFEEALPIWRQFGEKWHIAGALGHLGRIAQHAGDYVHAVEIYRERVSLLREMGHDEAAILTLEGQITALTAQKGATRGPNDLTQRELELLRLVALGKSNPQIAEALTLSINTVQAHLRTIYSKIGVTSRTEAARYAFEHDLT